MPNPGNLPDYVASLELHPGEPLPTPAPAASAVVAGSSIVSFVAGLSPQNREDVLNSTLLMQLAANKAFDKASQSEHWFRFYSDGLARLGWTITNNSLEKYQVDQASFTLDQVALDIIDGLAGGQAYTQIAKRSLGSLQQQSQAHALFQHCSASGNTGNFQILPCVQSEDGGVAMLMNCIHLVKNTTRTGMLFLTFGSNDVKIFRAAQIAVLNEDVYSQARSAVREKLGSGANRFLADLVI